tara:strand:- start:2112 stop:2591 length:480 start_codon:yes stop_codon:yes gene_type:complete
MLLFWYKKKSRTHGFGLFANKNIKKNQKIIQYIGNKISKKEGDRIADKHLNLAKKNKKNGQVYIFELNKRFDIDGNVKENYAKYINHSCDPNCEVEIINNQIWIIAIKNIKKNNELTYNYGYSYDTDYYEHVCKCGSKKCIGYILDEDSWDKIKKNINL